jgi:hypothetical protein
MQIACGGMVNSRLNRLYRSGICRAEAFMKATLNTEMYVFSLFFLSQVRLAG